MKPPPSYPDTIAFGVILGILIGMLTLCSPEQPTARDQLIRKWGLGEPNNPEFLREYRQVTGHDYFCPERIPEDVEYLMTERLYEFVPDYEEINYIADACSVNPDIIDAAYLADYHRRYPRN